MILERTIARKEISSRLGNYRVTAILGPRQCGKTTLAKTFKTTDYFDLENPRDLARLDQPQLALEGLKGLIVIDEIQRKPDLFPLLRYLVDTLPEQKYLILGSASRDLIRQSSETLAGRISYFELSGFDIHEFGADRIPKLWLRGGLPSACLARSDEQSFKWREDYITSFLERDIPSFGIRIPSSTLRRFWQMISHYHGGILNTSELGRSFGMAHTTVRHYIDVLQGTFMLRLLQPWHSNSGKRLVKSPKIYMRDSGVYHTLLMIPNMKMLACHPKLGASWEGFALEMTLRSIGKNPENIFFWATHSGAEAELFWQHGGGNWACEFKYSDAPKLGSSMISAMESLKLNKLWGVYPGSQAYSLHEKIDVIPLSKMPGQWKYPRIMHTR